VQARVHVQQVRRSPLEARSRWRSSGNQVVTGASMRRCAPRAGQIDQRAENRLGHRTTSPPSRRWPLK
jgi:hypothetical protein